MLDNVDQILDVRDRDAFLIFLSEMNKCVIFIVTSRQTFGIPDMNVENIRLGPLSSDAAMQMLISRILNPKVQQKLIKVDKLAELCGNVPPALSVVGPLLSQEHYTEDALIECLQQEPSVVLQKERRSTDQWKDRPSCSRVERTVAMFVVKY